MALAAIRRREPTPDRRCLVVGAGSQGALLCVALAAQGITPYVLEPHEGRRQLAESLGARPAATDDAGFGTVFETSGADAALGEAVRRAARGATVVLIGLGGRGTQVNTRLIVRRQLTLRGSLIYDHPCDFAATLRAAIPSPGRVLRARYPVAEAAAAFRAAREVPGKTWIQVSG